jgi:NinB protein
MSDFSASYIVRDEKILARVLAMIRGNWQAMAARNEAMVVQLSAETTTRSPEANRRYWALLTDIAASAWVDGRQFSKEAWHAHFVGLLLPKIEGPHGQMLPISTTMLTTREFAHFMGQVEAYAATELALEIA